MAEGRLREVELDAIRIQTKRFKDDEEDRQYKLEKEAEKAGEVTPPVEPAEPDEEPAPPASNTFKKGK